jgi:ubiquinone/menaquinone biosynthesis C-methylase UbiE
MSNIYTTGEYLENHPNWHAEDSPLKANNIMKMINKIEDKVSSICEVGCGAGEILNQLHNIMSQHVTLSGFDISPGAISI